MTRPICGMCECMASVCVALAIASIIMMLVPPFSAVQKIWFGVIGLLYLGFTLIVISSWRHKP